MLHNYLRQALPPGLTQSPCHPDAEGVANKTQATQQCLRHIFEFARSMDYQQAKGRFDDDANSTKNTGTLLLMLAYMYSLYEGGFCLPAVQVTLAEVFTARAPLPDARTHFDQVLQQLQTMLRASSTDRERAVALNELIYDQNVLARPRDSTEDGAQALAQLYAMKTKAEVDSFVDKKMEARHNHHPVLGPIKNVVQGVMSIRPHHVLPYAKQLGVGGAARTFLGLAGGTYVTYAGAAAAGLGGAWPMVLGGAAMAFATGLMSKADRALYRAQIRQTKGCEGWLAGTALGSALDHEGAHGLREVSTEVSSVMAGLWAFNAVPRMVEKYSPVDPLQPMREYEKKAADIQKALKDLELDPGTTDESKIKKHYHTLAKKYHPDKHRSSDKAQKAAAKEMTRINEAYNVILKDFDPEAKLVKESNPYQ